MRALKVKTCYASFSYALHFSACEVLRKLHAHKLQSGNAEDLTTKSGAEERNFNEQRHHRLARKRAVEFMPLAHRSQNLCVAGPLMRQMTNNILGRTALAESKKVRVTLRAYRDQKRKRESHG